MYECSLGMRCCQNPIKHKVFVQSDFHFVFFFFRIRDTTMCFYMVSCSDAPSMCRSIFALNFSSFSSCINILAFIVIRITFTRHNIVSYGRYAQSTCAHLVSHQDLRRSKFMRSEGMRKKCTAIIIWPKYGEILMNFYLCYFVQVIMGDRASAERACKDPNPIIDGRKANVNLAILGAKPRGNLTSGKLTNFISSKSKRKVIVSFVRRPVELLKKRR